MGSSDEINELAAAIREHNAIELAKFIYNMRGYNPEKEDEAFRYLNKARKILEAGDQKPSEGTT